MVVLTSGNLGLQRRFARLAGLRAGRLPSYPGTATGWSNATLPGTTAFVVELPPGRPLSPCDRTLRQCGALGFRRIRLRWDAR